MCNGSIWQVHYIVYVVKLSSSMLAFTIFIANYVINYVLSSFLFTFNWRCNLEIWTDYASMENLFPYVAVQHYYISKLFWLFCINNV